MHRVSAAIILKSKDGRFLLQHRENKKTIYAPNTWSFFGGGFEKTDRTLEDSVAREAFEETELKIDKRFLKQIGLFEKNGRKEYFFLYAKPIDIKKLVLHEGDDMKLFTRWQIIFGRKIEIETRRFLLKHNSKF